MSPAFNLADYEPVEDRLRAFWEDHPNGRVSTKLERADADGYIVFAAIWRDITDPHPAATGLASEAVTERGVNATSALENCETSALGRSLANLGYAPKGKRPSREEMAKTKRAPVASDGEAGVTGVRSSDGQAQGVVAGSVDAPQHPSEDVPTDPEVASSPPQAGSSPGRGACLHTKGSETHTMASGSKVERCISCKQPLLDVRS